MPHWNAQAGAWQASKHRSRLPVRGVAVIAGLVLSAAGVGAGWAAQASGSNDTPTPAAAAAAPSATCSTTGPAQRAVEAYLKNHPEYGRVKADGAQSAAECGAIRRMQARFGVRSPSGVADSLTGAFVARLRAAPLDRCGPNEQRVRICVDLTTQTMWVYRDGTLALGPTIIRSGKRGEETLVGDFTITQKKQNAVSTITGTPMHYWEHMRDGYGFHQAWAYLHDPKVPGSLGCVTMTEQDAKDLFGLTKLGSAVHIFGHKPGTT
jgi:lipoprotein-anchoring transpeptidase ErfK/SrfK